MFVFGLLQLDGLVPRAALRGVAALGDRRQLAPELVDLRVSLAEPSLALGLHLRHDGGRIAVVVVVRAPFAVRCMLGRRGAQVVVLLLEGSVDDREGRDLLPQRLRLAGHLPSSPSVAAAHTRLLRRWCGSSGGPPRRLLTRHPRFIDPYNHSHSRRARARTNHVRSASHNPTLGHKRERLSGGHHARDQLARATTRDPTSHGSGSRAPPERSTTAVGASRAGSA